MSNKTNQARLIVMIGFCPLASGSKGNCIYRVSMPDPGLGAASGAADGRTFTGDDAFHQPVDLVSAAGELIR